MEAKEDIEFTILVVEDSKLYSKLIVKSLTTIFPNCTCIKAFNGEDGINEFNTNKVDIILTDMQMPFVSGPEMIDIIRKYNTNIPIIAMSADKETFEDLDKLQVTKTMIKPIDLPELITLIKDTLHMPILTDNTRSKINSYTIRLEKCIKPTKEKLTKRETMMFVNKEKVEDSLLETVCGDEFMDDQECSLNDIIKELDKQGVK